MITEIRDDFDLEKIAASGQCFRVRRYDDGGFRFFFGDHALYIRRTGKTSYAISCSQPEWETIWFPYFDLERNYREIRQKEQGKNAFFDAAMNFSKGIRVLRQTPWETLVTFLISQRKNIPAISRAVEEVAASYGHTVVTAYETLHAFPSPAELAGASEADFRSLGLGYRAPYVLDAVRQVNEGTLDLAGIAALDDEALLKKLQGVRGVGIKVASCVALFAYGRTGCVPVDVWISRAIEEDCGGCSPFSLYGEDAGILQQYVFFYERSKKG